MLATVGRGEDANGVWPGTAPPSIILCIQLHWRLVCTYEAHLGARPWLEVSAVEAWRSTPAVNVDATSLDVFIVARDFVTPAS
jgi:hypothetical protein